MGSEGAVAAKAKLQRFQAAAVRRRCRAAAAAPLRAALPRACYPRRVCARRAGRPHRRRRERRRAPAAAGRRGMPPKGRRACRPRPAATRSGGERASQPAVLRRRRLRRLQCRPLRRPRRRLRRRLPQRRGQFSARLRQSAPHSSHSLSRPVPALRLAAPRLLRAFPKLHPGTRRHPTTARSPTTRRGAAQGLWLRAAGAAMGLQRSR